MINEPINIIQWLKEDDSIIVTITPQGEMETIDKESQVPLADPMNIVINAQLPPAKRKVLRLLQESGVKRPIFQSGKQPTGKYYSIIGDADSDAQLFGFGDSNFTMEMAELNAIQFFIQQIQPTLTKQEKRDELPTG